jgi:Dolichyl-phosphate-mannose-protein mannosyltransferase
VNRYPVRLAIVCAVFIVACYALRLSLLHTRAFDPDELQHVHAAWAVHEGLVPFRDFFDHHMPGLQFTLAPMLGRFHVADAADDAIRFLFVARTLMWVFAGLVLALTVLLGTMHGGAAVGWLSGGLLTTSIVFTNRTLEIRPDTPGLAWWSACLIAVAMAVRQGADDDRRPRYWLMAGGFFFGCALVFNQKLLLAGPGILLFALLYSVHQSMREPRARVVDVVSFGLASAAPLVALLAYFWDQAAAGDFVQGVLITNLGWPREVSAGSTLHWMMLRDPWLTTMGGAGVVQAGIELRRERSTSLSTALLLFPTISLLVGLFIIPTPYPQYMLLMLPAGSVLGARFVWALCGSLPARTRFVRGGSAGDCFLVAASAIGLAAIGIYVSRPFFLHPAAYPALGVATFVAVAVLASRGKVEWTAVVLLCACSAYTIQQLRWMQGESNADALHEMRYVHAMTQPTDRVLDGFSGLSWFRPHASFYPFLHQGVRNHLSVRQAAGVVEVLAKCAERPKLVILDEHLIRISPAVAPLVSRFYEPSHAKLIWIRKTETCHENKSEGAERAFQ